MPTDIGLRGALTLSLPERLAYATHLPLKEWRRPQPTRPSSAALHDGHGRLAFDSSGRKGVRSSSAAPRLILDRGAEEHRSLSCTEQS